MRYGLFIIVALFLSVGFYWILENRAGQPLDIDEAGYLSYATSKYYALKYGGLKSWLSSVYSPSIQAPLVTAMASILFYFTGINNFIHFLVPLFCAGATIIVTYLIAVRLANQQAGFIAALLISSCPGIVSYSRSYHFAIPATLIYTCAVYCLIRSNRFSTASWSIAFGIFLGLLPLARTMTIAFVPGFVVAALCYILAENENKFKRIFMLAASLVLGIILPATWYIPNGRLVWNYLTGYGYGSHVAEYAKKLSENYISEKILLLCNSTGLLFPHFLYLTIGFITCILFILKISQQKHFFISLIKSNFLPVVIISIFSFTALQSSKNVGSGFYCPLFPSVFACITALCILKTHSSVIRNFYLITALLIFILTSVAPFPLQIKMAEPLYFNVPFIGSLRLTDGGGNFLSYLKESKVTLNSNGRLEPQAGNEWLEFDKHLAGKIDSTNIKNDKVVWGFRHHLCNVNSVNLQELRLRKKAFASVMVDPSLTPDTVDGYRDWIINKQLESSIIITSNASGTFEPLVNPVHMREALLQLGFLEYATLDAPDGQIISLWKKSPPENALQ
jgi:hypothetical protein